MVFIYFRSLARRQLNGPASALSLQTNILSPNDSANTTRWTCKNNKGVSLCGFRPAQSLAPLPLLWNFIIIGIAMNELDVAGQEYL